MTVLFIILHVLVCMILITIILLQPGKGGGFTQGFAAAETLFGAKTTTFMVKATAILATVFIVTASILAYLSSKKDKSLMSDRMNLPPMKTAATIPLSPTAAKTTENQSASTAEKAQTPTSTSTDLPTDTPIPQPAGSK